MRDVTRITYTFWAMLLLVVMLIGSPLSGFGCQTIVPEQLQVNCETSPGGTAVQSNFLQTTPTTLVLFVTMAIACWLRPRYQSPKEIYLTPPLHPPRPFV